jgi:tetratricopeptide (TPR) repeat protein
LRSFLIVYDLYGWHTTAIKRLETLIQALRSRPEPEHAVEVFGLALSFQGWFHFRRGQLQEASDRFEQGLAILRPLQDPMVLADVLTLASTVMASLGQADQALQYINEGLAAARASGNSWRMAHASMMEGGIVAGWGEYDRAYRSLLEALTRFRALGDTRLTVVTLNTLGFVALQSSRYAEARQHVLESLALINAAEDPWSAGIAYGNLGIVELEQGNIIEARRLLQKSIPIVADLGMMADVSHFMTYLGETALREGAIEEAESHWLDAIRIAHETQAMPTVLAILVRLAQLDAGRNHLLRAYKWSAFVASHPAAWQDSKRLAERLCGELASRLSAEQLASLEIPYAEGTLEHLVQEILARTKPENNGS